MQKPHTLSLNRGLLISAGLICLGMGVVSCQAKQNTGLTPVPDIVRWSSPETDNVALLSTEPNECIAPSVTAKTARSIAYGRLAFSSPFLLGGQAARRGLTCQACHGQGQTNTHFFVTGLSDKPGNADVTSFHFSDELGDESFNPVPIPSLSDDVEGVDSDPLKDDLDIFVTRLITKEFTGPEPSKEVFAALLSYIRALDNKYCDVATLSQDNLMAHKSRIISEGFSALLTNDQTQDTLNFMSAALRQEIGRLYERFPNQDSYQNELAAISQNLNARGGNISLSSIQDGAEKWNAAKEKLPKYYEVSLFNPSAIKKWDDARR